MKVYSIKGILRKSMSLVSSLFFLNSPPAKHVLHSMLVTIGTKGKPRVKTGPSNTQGDTDQVSNTEQLRRC